MIQGKKKRFCVDLPGKMYNKVWRMSGNFKINLVAQCLLVEFLTDPELQARVKSRLHNQRR